jgi:tetratricopeptide (TPR) repeat protein
MDFLANDVKNLITKGNLLAELGHYDEAISYYLKILQFEPDNQEALMNLGNSLIALKKYPESIICYDHLLKTDLNNALAWQQKGYSLLQMNRTEEAISCLDFSIQNNPHNSFAFFLIADMLMKLEKYNEAIFCYDKCLETCQPDFYFKASWNRGLAYDNLGRKNERNTQEKIESNFSTTTNCEEPAPTPTGQMNYYENVGYFQKITNDKDDEPGIDSSQIAQGKCATSSTEIEEEPDYFYDYSLDYEKYDDEDEDEIYQNDYEMKNLGDYNLIQYYKDGCNEDDYEIIDD